MKKISLIIISIFSFMIIERLCHHATDGFAVVNISAPKFNTEAWNIPPLHEDLGLILDQKFTYLDCGAQCYVFLSQDQKTVIKFFKFQHLRIHPLLHYIPLPRKWSEYREAKRIKKQEILMRTYDSCKIAYDHLKEESGLIYVRLTKSPELHQSVTIVDKIGREHLIDLNATEFILQKRANGVRESIDEWMKAGKVSRAKDGIKSLFELSIKRCKEGVFDKDPDFSTNFGFDGNQAIQLDIGRFSYDDTRKDPLVYIPEMTRITRQFQMWIDENHPDLLEYFDEQLVRTIEKTS